MKTQANKTPHRRLLTAAAAMLLAAGAGCGSHDKKLSADEQSADQANYNRLLIRMAAAENVYNGIAAEAAVYPADFKPGSSTLNELGSHRVAMLANAYRDGSAGISVIRGEESEAVYSARVAAVRQAFADAGLDLEKVTVAKGGSREGTPSTSSERTILTFNRMMSNYLPQQGGSSGGGAGGMESSMPMAPSVNGGSNGASQNGR